VAGAEEALTVAAAALVAGEVQAAVDLLEVDVAAARAAGAACDNPLLPHHLVGALGAAPPGKLPRLADPTATEEL
jgi:hypothetical protein